jgi:hypothetical protein
MKSVPLGSPSFLAALAIAACGAVAYSQDAAPPNSQDTAPAAAPKSAPDSGPPATPLSPDQARALAAAVNATYYHPDGLAGLACAADIDWTSLSRSTTSPEAASRLKSLQGMTIQVHALRDQPAQVDVSWPQAAPANAASMENGVRQMLQGFFQSYWAMSAAPAIPPQAGSLTEQDRAQGGKVLHYAKDGVTMTEEIDRDDVPVKSTFENAMVKGSVDLHYSPSPHPKPGDLRRLTAIDISQQMGTSILNTNVTMDYQTVDGFDVPHHVVFVLPGSFSIPINFSNCSATKAAKPGS